ncbi:MAG: hypothetical protein QW303_08150 [Nitrososphaerota archaeon]
MAVYIYDLVQNKIDNFRNTIFDDNLQHLNAEGLTWLEVIEIIRSNGTYLDAIIKYFRDLPKPSFGPLRFVKDDIKIALSIRDVLVKLNEDISNGVITLDGIRNVLIEPYNRQEYLKIIPPLKSTPTGISLEDILNLIPDRPEPITPPEPPSSPPPPPVTEEPEEPPEGIDLVDDTTIELGPLSNIEPIPLETFSVRSLSTYKFETWPLQPLYTFTIEPPDSSNKLYLNDYYKYIPYKWEHEFSNENDYNFELIQPLKFVLKWLYEDEFNLNNQILFFSPHAWYVIIHALRRHFYDHGYSLTAHYDQILNRFEFKVKDVLDIRREIVSLPPTDKFRYLIGRYPLDGYLSIVEKYNNSQSYLYYFNSNEVYAKKPVVVDSTLYIANAMLYLETSLNTLITYISG